MAADGDYTVIVWADLPNEGRVGAKVTSNLSIGVKKEKPVTQDTAVDHPVRTWSAASGATIEASFVKFEAGKVYLKKATGTTTTIRTMATRRPATRTGPTARWRRPRPPTTAWAEPECARAAGSSRSA